VTAPEGGRLPVVESGDACVEGCITCGDIAVEVEIARLLPRAMAVVTTEAGPEEVSVALVDAGVGDTVLVHAGEAIAVIRR
jgi:hydrogenase expression/formation protein HypC